MSIPDFSFEKLAWKRGFQLVIGVDEVGRGAFAGPLVAGACALKIMNHALEIRNIEQLGINDSKQLSSKKRELLDPLIKSYFFWAIGETNVEYINRFGIQKATEKAFRQAVVKLLYQVLAARTSGNSPSMMKLSDIQKIKPYVFLDAFKVKYVPIVGLKHQQAVVKGDEKCLTIAAASIIAKVYRDELMRSLSKEFAQYKWQENKGYGSSFHREKIKEIGLTKQHRVQFCKHFLPQ